MNNSLYEGNRIIQLVTKIHLYIASVYRYEINFLDVVLRCVAEYPSILRYYIHIVYQTECFLENNFINNRMASDYFSKV